jgi:FkbM family methyltransferase
MTISAEQQRRIEHTVACHDAATIPKVPEAGQVMVRAGQRLQVMHNGVLVEADTYYGEWMTELITQLKGHHEPQEEAVFHQVVMRLRADTPAPTMVELGAFWGYYSLWFQHALPGGSCVLIEPDPTNLAVGRRNFTLNGATATFLDACVGNRHGALVPFRCESDGLVRTRRCVTVDGVIKDLRLERVDVLLCDTQGAELTAVRGAAQSLLAGRLRFLFLSTHHHSISGDPLLHQKALHAVQNAGAHVIAEHTVSESHSGDGLIVASFDARDRNLAVPISYGRARNSLFGELEYDLAATAEWSARGTKAVDR